MRHNNDAVLTQRARPFRAIGFASPGPYFSRCRRGVVAVLVSLFAAQNALAFDASELMSMMAKVDESTVAFQETKEVAALTTPIVRRGTLHYVRPDRMEMRVAEPYFENLMIAGDRLVIENRKGKREIDLSAVPAASAWIASLRSTLSGDLEGLKRYYRYELTGSRNDWALELLPTDRALAEVVAHVRIEGKETQIARIVIEERQGDRTTLVVPAARQSKR